MAVNKVVRSDGTILIDLTGDTVTHASHIISGRIGHLADGTQVTGTGQGSGTTVITVNDTSDSSGGTIRTITAVDISDTTAVASDVAQGKYFYNANGVKTAGTASSGPSVTKHTIHLEFSDETDTDIDIYYDDALLGTMITAYEPVTYGNKTVTLAQLDNVTWYEPTSIPIGVELIDHSKAINDYAINSNGEVVSQEWYSVSDYTPVASGMTFSYTGSLWFDLSVYDSSKNLIGSIYIYNDATADQNDSNIGHGTLSGQELPSNAAYVRITGGYNPSSSTLSLVRTA